MASSLAPALPVVPPAPQRSAATRFVRLLVTRRVPISIVLFTTLVLVSMFVVGSRPRDVLNLSDPLVVLSEVLILLGLAIRSWAAGTLRKRMELAVTGPYAWVRNPLYAGSFCMMIGFCTLVHPLALVVVAVPVAILYWLAIRSEEIHLAGRFPEAWPEYVARVPRLLPRRLVWPSAHSWSLSKWLHNEEYMAWLGSLAAVVGLKLWQLWL